MADRHFNDVAEVFKDMESRFSPEVAGDLDRVFQYEVTGPKGGSWAIYVKDGKCSIKAEKAEKPACTITVKDEDFLDLFSGKIGGMAAFSSGKLVVTGDFMKSAILSSIFPNGLNKP